MKNDGKYLEEEVEKYFKTIKKSTFHWRRLPDARAARGLIPAQPADFFFSVYNTFTEEKTPVHLECKSVKGKKARLPKPSQFPTMLRWTKAGVQGIVVVHFWELDKFSYIDVSKVDGSKPSWVLTELYATLFDVMEEIVEWVI